MAAQGSPRTRAKDRLRLLSSLVMVWWDGFTFLHLWKGH